VGIDYQDQGMVFADVIGRPVHPNTLTGHFHEFGVPAEVDKRNPLLYNTGEEVYDA